MKTKISWIILIGILWIGSVGFNTDTPLIVVVLGSVQVIVIAQLVHYYHKKTQYIEQNHKEKMKLNGRALWEAKRRLTAINSTLEEEVELRVSQLMQNERLAFVGLNAAELVHNIRNPLFIIQSYAELIGDDPKHKNNVEKLLAANKRASEIVTAILSSARVGHGDSLVEVNINRILKEEIELLKISPFYKNNISSHVELGNIEMTKGLPLDWHQVIGNLLKNSLDAMESKNQPGELSVLTTMKDGWVELQIKDTGEGIAPENLKKVFESSFTTKFETESGIVGTGLGMPFCKKIIERHGGEISISSQLGIGTTVTVRVPSMAVDEKESEEVTVESRGENKKKTHLKLVS